MNKLYQKALFIFRRDFRLEDNTGLIFALENAKIVIPCFIFTPSQIEHNPYKSDHCLQFMIESLEELGCAIRKKNGTFYLFYGEPEDIIEKCIEQLSVDAVIVNRDYTPYSRKRDLKLETICQKLGRAFHSFDDALLNPPEHTLKADGTPYRIFTPFYKNAVRLNVARPAENTHKNYYNEPISFAQDCSLYEKVLPKRFLKVSGGRSFAMHILKNMGHFADYKQYRDFPAEEKTTHLSAHLKFNTCSIREVYLAAAKLFGSNSDIIRALYWRDFFTSIAFYFPEVFSGAFQKKFDQLKWSRDKHVFKNWCEGKTGFPIVDAGMREMNQTGFMHNRVRMIVASFLVKDLHIDWRWGEKYFGQMLLDYDPCVNNGNWQWAAGTGCDAQPYFRIFNPWTQSLKFDPNCVYIKKWIPELASIAPSIIHKWHLHSLSASYSCYPMPLVDHAIESKKALELYSQLSFV